jgi:hypothetical protein
VVEWPSSRKSVAHQRRLRCCGPPIEPVHLILLRLNGSKHEKG